MEELTKGTGLKINVDTTTHMNTSKHKHDNMHPKNKNINDEALQCEHLGALGTYNNDCGKDTRARITAGNRYYQVLSKIMKSGYISKHTKLKIHTTMTTPIVLYGCETHDSDRENEINPENMEAESTKQIYGPVKD
jgi:hypothetical protein